MSTQPRPLGLGRYFVGLAGAAGGALTGIWLVTSPFALAYQPGGAAWAEATRVGVFTGLAVLAVSVTGAGLLVADLVAELRNAGVLPARPSRAERRAARRAQRAARLADRRGRETPEVPAASPAAGSHNGADVDLHQLAALLLEELRQARPRQPEPARHDHPQEERHTPQATPEPLPAQEIEPSAVPQPATTFQHRAEGQPADQDPAERQPEGQRLTGRQGAEQPPAAQDPAEQHLHRTR